MLTKYFYHSSIKRAVSIFGTLFNNISIVRRDSSGKIVHQEQKVPLAYGPRDHFLARIKEEESLTDGVVAMQLPRISFEITSLSYDTETALPMLGRTNHSVTYNSDNNRMANSATRTYNYAPYKLGIQLSVMTKQQDDSFQIIEQILPYFRPDFIVTIRQLNEDTPESIWDMPITLTSVSPSIQHEGEVGTNKIIIHTLDFELRVRMFGPTNSQGVIHKVTVNYRDLGTSEIYDVYSVEAVANPDNLETGYDLVETISNSTD